MRAFLEAPLPELCRVALQAGLSLLIQSSLILGIGLAAAVLLRRRGPAAHSIGCKATLLSVIVGALLSVRFGGSVSPVWSLTLPTGAATLTSPAPESASAAEGSRSRGREGTRNEEPRAMSGDRLDLSRVARHSSLPTLPHALTFSAPVADRDRSSRVPWLAWLYVALAGVWVVVAVALLAQLALCHAALLRLKVSCVPIEGGGPAEMLRDLCATLGLRPPRLLAGSGVRSPFLAGLRRPAILLPASYATDFDPEVLRAILAHELVHLARRDCGWNWLGRVACAAGWPQPLLWVLCRRMEQASEELCDQAVIARHCSPRAYAHCLLDLAERILPCRAERTLGAGVVPSRSSLGRRIEQIAAGTRSGTLSLSVPLRAAVGLSALGAAAVGFFLIAPGGEPIAAWNGGEAGAEVPVAGPFSGRVLSPAGEPVSGAEVFWTGRVDRETRVRDRARTDATGRFRFADAARLRKMEERPQLLVVAGRLGFACRDIGRYESEIEVTLGPVTRLQVDFLDPDRKPVPNLKVAAAFLTAQGLATCTIPVELATGFGAVTHPDGSATIANLPQGYDLRLEVRDARFAQLTYEDRIPLGPAAVTEAKPIHLLPAASVQGRITFGPTGKPAAGIRVGAQGTVPDRGWGEAVTDASGHYNLQQLRAGTYNIALDLKDGMAPSWTAAAHERVVIGAGERLNGIDFTLIRGAVLKGKVMAADNGAPVAGGYLGVYGPAHPRSGAWVQGTQTGPDGRYLLRVPAGSQHLYLSMATPPSGFLLPAQKAFDLAVKDGETRTVDFRLPRGRVAQPIHGRVLGPDESPVAGAEVLVTPSGLFRAPMTRWTDAQGAFTLEDELAAQPVTLRSRHQGMATTQATAATAGDRVTLRLAKNTLVTLSGTVTNTTGEPIAGARVKSYEWIYGSGWGGSETTTDAQGRYALESLWSNAIYSLQATAPGYGEKSADRIEVKQGETRTLPPFVLAEADRSVGGRVVDASGAPMAGIMVTVSGRQTSPQSQSTDRLGGFRFDGVVDETVKLQASAGGDRWTQKRVPAGTMDAVLVLPQPPGQGRVPAGDGLQERFAALQGRAAPPLRTAAWVDSRARGLEQLRGKVVLIDFWSIGCGPCVASLPGVQRIADQFARKGVVVIGLHDASTSPSALAAFARTHHLRYPLAIDAPEKGKRSPGQTFGEYGVRGIPSVAVIDREGKLAYLGGSLEEAVASLGGLLGGPAPHRDPVRRKK